MSCLNFIGFLGGYVIFLYHSVICGNLLLLQGHNNFVFQALIYKYTPKRLKARDTIIIEQV